MREEDASLEMAVVFKWPPHIWRWWLLPVQGYLWFLHLLGVWPRAYARRVIRKGDPRP